MMSSQASLGLPSTAPVPDEWRRAAAEAANWADQAEQLAKATPQLVAAEDTAWQFRKVATLAQAACDLTGTDAIKKMQAALKEAKLATQFIEPVTRYLEYMAD